MSEQKFTEYLQIRVSREMKQDLVEIGGDMSQNVRDGIQCIINSKKQTNEEIEKKRDYHLEEAKKQQAVLDRINETERTNNEIYKEKKLPNKN